MDVPPAEYCRAIEAYLCRKNDGHLIRVVGPSFELVSRWAAEGVPLKVAFRGIDRCFERYYRKGPRRRPVRIDFCEADVLDVFDEWRRATGIGSSSADAAAGRRQVSLPAHLERILARLTQAIVARALGDSTGQLDDLAVRVSHELDVARTAAGGLRGEARRALRDRLAALDAEIGELTRAALDETTRAQLDREAQGELAAFRDRLPDAAYRRAHAAIVDRLARERVGMPTIAF